jgi:hypothetical protein
VFPFFLFHYLCWGYYKNDNFLKNIVC